MLPSSPNLQSDIVACCSCWHRLLPIDNYPYGNNISSIIMFEGGNLDAYKTCTLCNWNKIIETGCSMCKNGMACPSCYSSVYNGCLIKNTCDYIHNLYMCNSPYNTKWKNRPFCIGQFYAKQVSNKQNIYIGAINTARSFLMIADKKRLYDFNALEFAVSRAWDKALVFWSGVTTICNTFNNKSNKIFIALDSFFQTIKTNIDSNVTASTSTRYK